MRLTNRLIDLRNFRRPPKRIRKRFTAIFSSHSRTLSEQICKYLDGETPDDIHKPYRRVRTLGVTRAWSGKESRKPNQNSTTERYIKKEGKDSGKHKDVKRTEKIHELKESDSDWGRGKKEKEVRHYSRHFVTHAERKDGPLQSIYTARKRQKILKKRIRPLTVVVIDYKGKNRSSKNVASEMSVDSSFIYDRIIYDCTINKNHYQCQLDTAASDIFLWKI